MVVIAPFGKKISFFIFNRMKEIAYDDQFHWLEKLNKVKKAVQIVFVNILWNGNSRFPEMPGFAKMEIG